MVSVSDDSLCTVAITNYAPYPISLKQCSDIEIEGVQGKIEHLSQTKVKYIFECINLVNGQATSSQSLTREQIEQHTNLNLPKEF